MIRYAPDSVVDVRVGRSHAGVEWVPGIVEEVVDLDRRDPRYHVFTAFGVLRRCHPASLRPRLEVAA